MHILLERLSRQAIYNLPLFIMCDIGHQRYHNYFQSHLLNRMQVLWAGKFMRKGCWPSEGFWMRYQVNVSRRWQEFATASWIIVYAACIFKKGRCTETIQVNWLDLISGVVWVFCLWWASQLNWRFLRSLWLRRTQPPQEDIDSEDPSA